MLCVVDARLVLDLLWCVVSDLVPDLVHCVCVEYLVTDLICCLVSTYWSGVVCASGLVSCLVAGI